MLASGFCLCKSVRLWIIYFCCLSNLKLKICVSQCFCEKYWISPIVNWHSIRNSAPVLVGSDTSIQKARIFFEDIILLPLFPCTTNDSNTGSPEIFHCRYYHVFCVCARVFVFSFQFNIIIIFGVGKWG